MVKYVILSSSYSLYPLVYWRLLRGRAVRDCGLGVQWGNVAATALVFHIGRQHIFSFSGASLSAVRKQREPTDFFRVPIASVWAVSEPTSALNPIDASVALRPLIGLAFFH